MQSVVKVIGYIGSIWILLGLLSFLCVYFSDSDRSGLLGFKNALRHIMGEDQLSWMAFGSIILFDRLHLFKEECDEDETYPSPDHVDLMLLHDPHQEQG